jgi:hypothetical protein
LIINRGKVDGLRPRDPVVSLGGLVGIVQRIYAHTARVQAITDPLSAVGAIDRDRRARGVVYGKGRHELMWFIPENEVQPIEIGAVLVTSGFENSIYPKGVVVGIVQERKHNRYGMPYGAVKPAVGFESLEEVLLVIPKHRARGDDLATTPTMGHYTIQIPSIKLAGQADHTTGTATIRTTDTLTTATLSTDTLTTATLPPGSLGRADAHTTGSLHRPVAPLIHNGQDTVTTHGVQKPGKPAVRPKATPKATPKVKTPPPEEQSEAASGLTTGADDENTPAADDPN